MNWIPDLIGKTEYGQNLYRNLPADEEETFRASARHDYEPHSNISSVWHPVYDDECHKINWDARSCNWHLYKIIKFICPNFTSGTVIMKRLSLERAKEICRSDSTRKEGEWFYGYDHMTSADISPSERYAEYLYQQDRAKARIEKDGQTGKSRTDDDGTES